MLICALIRGEITNKIYQAWQNSVPKRFPGYSLSSSYSSDCGIVVVGRSCNRSVLDAFVKGHDIAAGTKLVYSDWLITSLKCGKIQSFDPYLTNLGLSTTVAPIEQIESNFSQRIASDFFASQPSQLSTQISQTDAEASMELTQMSLASASDSRDADQKNHNNHITKILDELQAMYLLMGDQFRAQNYKKTSGRLKRMNHITSASELDGLTGFGKSLKTTIQEILDTGGLKKLDHLKKNPRTTAITVLSKIWGVGEKTAEQLYNQGYKTIRDLRERGKQMLNRQQLIGLQYYEEFLTRMPREEVEFIKRIVEEECKIIEPLVDCTICGSYRRGKADCGDVDILITPSTENPQDSLPGHTLSRLIMALERRGFLTDHLSLPSGHKEYVESSALIEIQRINASSMSVGSPSRKAGSILSSPSKLSQRSGSASQRSQLSFSQLPSLHLSQLMCQSPSMSPFISPPQLQYYDQLQSSGRLLAQSSLGNTTTQEIPGDSENISDGVTSDWEDHEEMGSKEQYDQEDYDINDDIDAGYGTQSCDEDDVTEPVKYDSYGGKKKPSTHRLYFGSRGSYMGVCQVPRPGALHRRIDIKVYPRSQKACALFYFTGSDSYNRGVRYYASKNGYALDDKGLMECVRDDQNKIVSRGELISCASEQDICENLGIEYLEPWDRAMFDPKTMVVRPLGPAKYGRWSAGWRKGSSAAASQHYSQSQRSVSNLTQQASSPSLFLPREALSPGVLQSPSECLLRPKLSAAEDDKMAATELGKRPRSDVDLFDS